MTIHHHPGALALACALGLAAGACTPAADADACRRAADCHDDETCIDGLCEPAGASEGSGGIVVVTEDGPDPGPPGVLGPEDCAEAEFVPTHAGCRFWAVDLPNAWQPSEAFGLDIAARQQFAVVVVNVTAEHPAKVEVFRGRDAAPVTSATVEPGEVHTFELPAQEFDPLRSGAASPYRIESDRPVAAYQFQPLSNNTPVYSNDATVLFPEHVLGTDYIAITGDAARLTMYPDGWDAVAYNAGAFITIVGTAAETKVDVYPTAGLLAPLATSLVLGRGDAFTVFSDLDNIQGSPTGDLSGTRVIADRPVAVFGGSVTTGVPIDSEACCADHLEHQMLPLWAWGHAYAVAPPPSVLGADRAAPALYRLTGAFAGTELLWPGGRPTGAPERVDAGETVVFQTDRAFVVRSADASRSFALTQFLLSSEAADSTGSGLGDPAMTVVPAVAQMQPSYGFLVPEGYQDNYVTIVASSTATVHLDGVAVEPGRSIGALDGVEYRYTGVRLEPGTHEVASDEVLHISVVGYDQWVSYAYTGGSGILPISDLPPIP